MSNVKDNSTILVLSKAIARRLSILEEEFDKFCKINMSKSVLMRIRQNMKIFYEKSNLNQISTGFKNKVLNLEVFDSSFIIWLIKVKWIGLIFS